MTQKIMRWLSVAILLLLYIGAWLAPFLAPYSPREQFREHALQPPLSLRSVAQTSSRPLTALERRASLDETKNNDRPSIQFFVRGTPYTWMGLSFRTHFYGSATPGEPLFLLGSDDLGRDLVSRILYGSRYSLSIGVVAIFFTLVIGVLAGACSGYLEGWADRVIMRGSDIFLSFPALFLVLGLRAVGGGEGGPLHLYLLIVFAFTLIGWASVARVVRGQVRSIKQREHVLYARACGASATRLLTWHILPFTRNFLLVQGSVLLPAYIIGEVTLTFLGLGVQEPDVSWGSLLVDATSLEAFHQSPWLLAPVGVTLLAVLSLNYLADDLKVILEEKKTRSSLGF